MTPSIKICLPPGKLGVTFKKNNPPAVSSVADDSPIKGKVKVGYQFDTLYLADGTEFSGLNSSELVQTLSDYMDEEGRKLKLRMALPSTTTVTVPPGDHGAFIEGEPPKISLIHRHSPLKDKLRVGMVVDSVGLEDGTEYVGHSAEEIESILKDSEKQARTLVLKNPVATQLSERAVKLPESKEVTLPAGKIGTIFQGNPAMITGMSDDSPMRSQFRVGMLADTLQLPDGFEYSGLKAALLTKVLSASATSEGRVMILKNPASRYVSKKSITKAVLPSGDLGIEFEGDPAVIASVAEDSPVYNKLWPGQIIETVGLADGTEYDELAGEDANDVINDSADTDGRWMLLQNQDEIIKLPDSKEVVLPAERLGVTFQGDPPIIARIAPDSSVRDQFMVGLAVDTLTMANGTKYMELSTPELVSLLRDSADDEGRVVLLKNPETTKMSKKPASMEVKLPRGRLGVVFVGTPPKVTRFLDGSPMADKIAIGLVVDMLTLEDGTILSGLSVEELVDALNESSDTDGRTMLLKNPATRRLSTRQILPPDEKVVELPIGPLGVSFKGNPAKISRIHDDSAMKGVFRVGMVIDTLTLPDGSTYSGLSSKEIGVVLRGSADVPGRQAILKNPDTSSLSRRNLDEKDAESAFFEDEELEEESQRG